MAVRVVRVDANSAAERAGILPGDRILTIDGGQIAHASMHNLNDFKISIFAWAQDLNFPAAASYLLEHRLYETLRTFLPDDTLMDRLLEASLARLRDKRNERS